METSYQALVPGKIFIGGADDVSSAKHNEQIDCAFDLRAEADQPVFSAHFHTPIVDDAAHQDTSIQQAVDKVVEAHNDGKKVYFHCQGGSNRTGTVAVGVLLSLKLAQSIPEAEEMAKAVRPKINIKQEMKDSLNRLYLSLNN